MLQAANKYDNDEHSTRYRDIHR